MLNQGNREQGVYSRLGIAFRTSDAQSSFRTFGEIEADILQRLKQDAVNSPLRPALHACIEGTQPGMVLLGRTGETMAVLHGDGLCFLCGAPSLSFVAEAKTMLEHMPVQNLAIRRVFVPWNKSWHEVLSHKALQLREGRRLSFESPVSPSEHRGPLSIGVMDAAVMDENADLPIIRQQIAAWGSVQHFVQRGKAFCRFEGPGSRHALSIASSFAIGGGEVEISVATRPESRGKGYAKEACSALIDWCFLTSRTPVWSCAIENNSSKGLARSLGFKPGGQYSVFVVI